MMKWQNLKKYKLNQQLNKHKQKLNKKTIYLQTCDSSWAYQMKPSYLLLTNQNELKCYKKLYNRNKQISKSSKKPSKNQISKRRKKPSLKQISKISKTPSKKQISSRKKRHTRLKYPWKIRSKKKPVNRNQIRLNQLLDSAPIQMEPLKRIMSNIYALYLLHPRWLLQTTFSFYFIWRCQCYQS